jgi:hypothetical protein
MSLAAANDQCLGLNFLGVSRDRAGDGDWHFIGIWPSKWNKCIENDIVFKVFFWNPLVPI